MVIPQAIVAGIAAREAQGVLRAGWEIANSGEAAYIRDGQGEGFIPALGLGLARAACRRYSGGVAGADAEGLARMEKACRPYLDSIGSGSGPSASQPWYGGLCVGVPYTFPVEIKSTTTGSWGQQTSLSNCFGPVQSVSIASTGANSCTVTIVHRNAGNTANVTRTYNASAPTSRTRVGIPTIPGGGDIYACGSPPLTYTPDAPAAPTPGPIQPVREPPGVDIEVNVDINPDMKITFDIGPDTVEIDPFSDPPPPAGGGTTPGDVGEPGAPEDTGLGGDAEGEAPPGSVLVGIRIAILALPPRPNEYADGVYRGAAYIYMGTADGLDQDYAGSMLSDNQFIFAEKDFLTSWRVRANTGYRFSVTPYYRVV